MRSPNGREEYHLSESELHDKPDHFITDLPKTASSDSLDKAFQVINRFANGKATDEDVRLLRDACRGWAFKEYCLEFFLLPLEDHKKRSDTGACVSESIRQNLINCFEEIKNV